VQEDQVMCEVMTEKAAVEMPAPVTGRILSISGEPGDMVAVGSELVVFDTDATSAAAGDAPAAKTLHRTGRIADAAAPCDRQRRLKSSRWPPPRMARITTNGTGTHKAARVMVSPASRRRATEAGLDLSTVTGTGPAGRIEPGDIDAALAPAPRAAHRHR
jgi:2-oxoisovalerate dehydrogenase E2 component (dihydrolipoyl transacylase)